jgi:hypothetical protein
MLRRGAVRPAQRRVHTRAVQAPSPPITKLTGDARSHEADIVVIGALSAALGALVECKLLAFHSHSLVIAALQAVALGVSALQRYWHVTATRQGVPMHSTRMPAESKHTQAHGRYPILLRR